jgi:hypothetical protein
MPYGTNAVIVEPWGGVNVDEAPHATAKHSTGYKVHDTLGREYTYCSFGGTVAQYSACKLTIGASPYASVVACGATSDTFAGTYFHATSATIGQYGWIITKGPAEILTSAVTASTSFNLGCSATTGTMVTIATAQAKTVNALTNTASGRSSVLIQ